MAEATTEHTSFSVGDVVRAHGLQNARELNGMVGVVFRQKKSGTVLAVQLLMRSKKIELQAKNLQHVDISGWGLPSNQSLGAGAAVVQGQQADDNPAQTVSHIASPITALPLASRSEQELLPSVELDLTKKQSQSSEDLVAAVMRAAAHRSPNASKAAATTNTVAGTTTLSQSSPDHAASTSPESSIATPAEVGDKNLAKQKFRTTESLFSVPAVQATLGGPQRAMQTRTHFEQPLQLAPRDRRANLAYAKLVLSVCVGVRASGVYVAAYPEYEKAVAAFQVAVDAAPRAAAGVDGAAGFSARERSEALISYGLLLQSGGELEKCLQCLESACDADPSNPAAFSLFAYCLDISGNYEKAVDNSRRTLELQPMHVDALSRLCAHTKEVDDALLQQVVATAAAADEYAATGKVASHGLKFEPKEHSIIYFTLARLQISIGQREEAARSLHRANAIARRIPENHFSIAAEEQKAEILLQTFHPRVWGPLWNDTNFGYHTEGTASNPTPIFIVGMPRSGSSLVEQILSSHPDVYGAGENTMFNPVVGQLLPKLGTMHPSHVSPLLKDAGRAYVQSMARRAGGAKFFTDKHLLNFWHLGLIHLMLPGAKVIHIVRDPMDTCFSCYRHHFEPGTITFSNSLRDVGEFYNLYRDSVAKFAKVVPSSMLLAVRYEDIVTDFDESCRAVFRHCGLDFPDQAKTFWKTQRVVDTNSATQVRRPLYKSGMGQWKQFENVKVLLPSGRSAGLTTAASSRKSADDSGPHQFLAELQTQLRRWYKSEP